VALLEVGVPAEKIRVVPLMYRADESSFVAKEFPARFDCGRPLRVLFLGSLIIRKGIHLALQVARLLAGAPVEFWFVGSIGVTLPDDLRENDKVRWIGPVNRSTTTKFYQSCDIFLFPTLSDGFGLTQLEAMGHGLPVIASNRCGDVVRHGVDGLVLSQNSPAEIAEVLRSCLAEPNLLRHWSKAARQRVQDFHPDVVLPRMLNVTECNPKAMRDA
jgi:glycosyltransferase involved in cell wall biosynthesis